MSLLQGWTANSNVVSGVGPQPIVSGSQMAGADPDEAAALERLRAELIARSRASMTQHSMPPQHAPRQDGQGPSSYYSTHPLFQNFGTHCLSLHPDERYASGNEDVLSSF